MWDDNTLKYWRKVDVGDDLSSVTYPHMPDFFNNLVNFTQHAAVSRFFKKIGCVKTAFDFGCGYGRFSKFLFDSDVEKVYAFDVSEERVKKYRENFSFLDDHKYIVFQSDSVINHGVDKKVDLLLDITVLQHVPYESQYKTFEHLTNMVNNNGFAITIVHTKPEYSSKYTFPASESSWEKFYNDFGWDVVDKQGVWYGFLYKILANKIQKMEYSIVNIYNCEIKRLNTKTFKNRFIIDVILRFVVYLSYPMELVAPFFIPSRYAKHTIFLLRKK